MGGSDRRSLSDGDREAVIEGRNLKVMVEKNPFRICVYDKEGTLLHASIVDLAYMEDNSHHRVRTSKTSPEGCSYESGEKSGDFSKAQRFMDMGPKDTMGYNPRGTDSLYKHIPFYIKLNRGTKRAVGYFYHNTYEYDFDMGHEENNYWKPHSRYRIDGGDIGLFLVADPAIRQVVERYTGLAGESAMFPRYALGYLDSSMYYLELDEDCDNITLDFVDTTKGEKIPIDGFQFSSGCCTAETDKGIKRCVFTWNKKQFKDPREFFVRTDKRDVSVSSSVRPGVLLIHPKLDKTKARGTFMKANDSNKPGTETWWGGKGVFTDFTKPSTQTCWRGTFRGNVLEYGTSSAWDDNCEYDNLMGKDCHCDFEGKGGTIGQLGSVMSNIMCHITNEAIHETFPNTRPCTVCRSGCCDMQRYAQTWTGDSLTCWNPLRYNIATILGMSLSGVANQGCDTGGFYGPSPEAELMVRWVQNDIFQPHFSVHSTDTDNTVTGPWMCGHCTDYIREAIELRYQLSPYFYSLMKQTHKTRLPIMEPMYSTFQEDVKCYEEGVDFIFGDSLLVASMVEKDASTGKVCLFEGETFYDFQTRTAYGGGRTVELPADLRSIPLFVRGGATVPVAEDKSNNLKTQQARHIRVLCAADGDGRFALYEDDGTSMDCEREGYLKTSIAMMAGERTILDFCQEGHYKAAIKTLYLDMVCRGKAPYWVKADGQTIPHFLHRKKFEEADCGWYYNQRLKSIQIRYPNPEKDYQVIVSFEQFDLTGM